MTEMEDLKKRKNSRLSRQHRESVVLVNLQTWMVTTE